MIEPTNIKNESGTKFFVRFGGNGFYVVKIITKEIIVAGPFEQKEAVKFRNQLKKKQK